jgi:hypothetical protein
LGSGYAILAAIKKYGKENFKRDVLHECDSAESMFATEASIVNEEFLSREDTYNIGGGGLGGRTVSLSTREKIGAAMRVRKLSDEHKSRIAESARSRTHSVETRLCIRESNKGRKRSEETKERMKLGALQRWAKAREVE